MLRHSRDPTPQVRRLLRRRSVQLQGAVLHLPCRLVGGQGRGDRQDCEDVARPRYRGLHGRGYLQRGVEQRIFTVEVCEQVFTDADSFQLDFPKGIDAPAKARMLGTTAFVNMLFFEDNGGGANGGGGGP